MATAANSLAQTDQSLRRARTPPATRSPCATLPRPQSLMRRRSAIPAGASRKPAVFAADGPRTSTDHRASSRPNIPAAARTPQCQHTIHPTPRSVLGRLTLRHSGAGPPNHLGRVVIFTVIPAPPTVIPAPLTVVIPAKAGIYACRLHYTNRRLRRWISAQAGMTVIGASQC